MSSKETLHHEAPTLKRPPERFFSLVSFKVFLADEMRLPSTVVEEYGSTLFAKKTTEEIADFLQQTLGFKKDDALEEARQMIRYEHRLFLEDQSTHLRPVFVRRHLEEFLNARSRQHIFSILEEHIPSFSESQLEVLVEKIGNRFNLPPVQEPFVKKEPILKPPNFGMSDQALGDAAYKILNKKPIKKSSAKNEVLTRAALTPKEIISGRTVEGEFRRKPPQKTYRLPQRSDFARENSVVVDPALLHDEPTGKPQKFHDQETGPRLDSLGAESEDE